MNNIKNVNGLSRRELNEMIRDGFLLQLKEIREQITSSCKPKLLTRIQTAEYLGIDLSTLYSWVKQGRVKMYSIGTKRYFKENEIIDSLVQLNPEKHDL